MTFKPLFLALLFAGLTATFASAQKWGPIDPELVPFYGDIFGINADAPPPSEILRKEPGAWHLRHDEIRRYFEVLAKASPRVKLVETGETWEGRPLFLAIITDPANHERLDEIRRRHLAWSDRPDAKLPADDQKLVVWLGYSVHGDESSGANAAPLVAYRLAVEMCTYRSAVVEDCDLPALLKDTVVIIDPCLNPDGLDRFAQWANSRRGQSLVGDPEHREHRQGWPSGRTNHYWFDLNRDWLLAQHPESKARLHWFHQWRPNVLTDHHEMGANSTFFFQPGVPSRTNPLTPPRNQELTALIAESHARALDKAGTLYYTKQGFDDFYYGKGSTYPDVNGGVGILFEQASSRGHLQETVNGPLRFPDTIANQVKVSFSTLQAAHKRRAALIEWQRTFYREARFAAAADPVKAWVFGDGSSQVRASGMARLLVRHGIDVTWVEDDIELDGEAAFAGGSFVVFADQPQYRLLKSLFEQRLTFQDPTFYDVSAWTLPLAYDVPFRGVTDEGENLSSLKTILARSQEPSRDSTSEGTNAARPGRTVSVEGSGSSDDFGRAVPSAGAQGKPAAYLPSAKDIGLVMDWRDDRSAAVLARLLAADLRLRVATRAFSALTDQGERHFAAGSLVLPYGIQDGTLAELATRLNAVRTASERDDRVWPEIRGIRSGLARQGPDLGSSDFRPIVKPEIALLVEGGVSAYDAGEFWHLLDTRFRLPVTHLAFDRLERADLGRYTHLILPGGRYSGLDDDAAQKVRAWVRAGGVLIATENACAWAAGEILQIKAAKSKATAARKAVPAPTPRPRWAERGARRAESLVAGTIYRGLIDPTHPLGFGYDDGELHLFKTSAAIMVPDSDPVRDVCVYPAENPRAAGYASKANDERIAGTAAVNHRSLGRGAVVRILDNPCFRAYWWGGFRLVANAIFFSRFGDARDLAEDDVDAHGHGH